MAPTEEVTPPTVCLDELDWMETCRFSVTLLKICISFGWEPDIDSVPWMVSKDVGVDLLLQTGWDGFRQDFNQTWH